MRNRQNHSYRGTWLLPVIAILLATGCGQPEQSAMGGADTPETADAVVETPPADVDESLYAPPLTNLAFVKGEPVDLAEGRGEKVYLLDFWATWCVPCHYQMPKLSQLQQEYGDDGLVIVAVTREPFPTVLRFLEAAGEFMEFRVAIDVREDVNQAYMTANGLETIPHYFIVGRSGAVVWNGKPAGLDAALQRALAR